MCRLSPNALDTLLGFSSLTWLLLAAGAVSFACMCLSIYLNRRG